MIPTIPKKYIKLVFHIFWPFIWPLRPSLAFFNFFEVLEVLEVQWHALVTYLTLLSSESIIVENFPFLITVACLYRVVKRNCQVAKLHCFEHLNENMVENSSPTCKHNLFALIQSKKMFVECPGMWESSKRLRESEFPCANLRYSIFRNYIF